MSGLADFSQEYLLLRLRYDPETGALFWRQDPAGTVQWNGRWAGKPAFTTIERGYLQGRIDWVLLYAHRVIWKMETGLEPEDIDHENGNRSDNRWVNLRDVSRTENMRNRMISSNNTSGHPGVSLTKWHTWKATIGVDNRTIVLGSFSSFDEAVAARKAAEVLHGYHQNHGRSSCKP
jgi:hypothetical protein